MSAVCGLHTRPINPSRVTASLLAIAGFGVPYSLLWRRRILKWGATDAQAACRLPGDELLENADGVSTRALEIDAPAWAAWRWIVQMGPSPRGGAYSYDWIENILGLNMHSAERVLEEFQHPQVGERIMNLALRCQRCGEVIGSCEPMIVLEDGDARQTSKAADQNAAGASSEHYHRSCYTGTGQPATST